MVHQLVEPCQPTFCLNTGDSIHYRVVPVSVRVVFEMPVSRSHWQWWKVPLSVHNEVPSHFEATLLICYNSSSELHNTTHINIFLFVHIQKNRTRLSTVGNKSAMSVLCSFLFSKLHGIFALLIIIHTKTVSTVSTPESLCSLHFEATLLKRVQMNDFHWPILSAEKSRRSCHLKKICPIFQKRRVIFVSNQNGWQWWSRGCSFIFVVQT